MGVVVVFDSNTKTCKICWSLLYFEWIFSPGILLYSYALMVWKIIDWLLYASFQVLILFYTISKDDLVISPYILPVNPSKMLGSCQIHNGGLSFPKFNFLLKAQILLLATNFFPWNDNSFFMKVSTRYLSLNNHGLSVLWSKDVSWQKQLGKLTLNYTSVFLDSRWT